VLLVDLKVLVWVPECIPCILVFECPGHTLAHKDPAPLNVGLDRAKSINNRPSPSVAYCPHLTQWYKQVTSVSLLGSVIVYYYCFNSFGLYWSCL